MAFENPLSVFDVTGKVALITGASATKTPGQRVTLGNFSCMVSWKPPTNDGGSPITGYTVERQSSFSPRWVTVNKTPTPDTSLKVDDLIEENSYQFRIIAHNKAGPSQPSPPSPNVLAKDPWSKCMLIGMSRRRWEEQLVSSDVME